MEKFDKDYDIYDYLGIYESKDYDTQMKMLKEFLLLSGEYMALLKEGKTIEYIFRKMADKNKLKYVDKNGVYHYTYEEEKRLSQIEMLPWDKEATDKHIYAIAYAFAKTNLDKNDCQIDIIKQKLKEMKRNAMDDLFFSDLIYLIRKKSNLYVDKDEKQEKRIESRQELIARKIGNHIFYEVPTFNQELDDFVAEVANEAEVTISDMNELSKYSGIVYKKIEQFKKYIRK